MNETSVRRAAGNGGPLASTVSIGRIAGIEVGLNWSWVIVFTLFVWSLASTYFPDRYPFLTNGTYFAMAVAATLLFFASLLLHELGHALQARHEGLEIDGITLWLFGGVARFRGMLPNAGAEFRIAAAGPFVTLVLSAFFYLLALLPTSQPVHGVLAWLGYVNLLLLAFNLVPALPLDGGRLLRSTLWRLRRDFGWATTVAGELGRAFGFLLIVGGVVLFPFYGVFTGIWFVIVGLFVLNAAEAERVHARAREVLVGLHVGDLMLRNPVMADPDQTIATFVDATAGSPRHALYPVVRNGELVGLLPFRRVAHVPRDEWSRRAVSECMLAADALPVLSEDDELLDAFVALGESQQRYGVVLRQGRFVGLLSLGDVERVVAEKQRLRAEKPRVPRLFGPS